ncbi:MAG: ABC transporter permease [Chitinophagales bacterium]|nr:ABC transporter permease [Chitinophagales bacterium]
MMFKISWRNVWRHKTRSLIVILAIAVGVWAGIFILGFYMGIMDQRIQDVIKTEVSHVQIHHKLFTQNYHPKFQIKNSRSILEDLNHDARVKRASGRNVSMVMIASANASSGVKLIGVNPDDESQVTVIKDKVLEGVYGFQNSNSIIVSRKLCDKLKLKLGSKVVVTMQSKSNELTADAFRVSGIYKTSNTKYDEATAFVQDEKLQTLLECDDYHEIAILLNSNDDLDPFTTYLSGKLPDKSVESWKDLVPGMRYMVETADQSLGIIMWIILLALVFGIINTMLMAVLERIREIGMLVAIGMSKIRVFFMIVLETVMLVSVGAPIGMLLGYIFITYFGSHGIDLSIVSEGMEEFGYATIVYPTLDFSSYIKVATQLVVLAIVSSIYPAWRTLQLKAIDAIRKI